MHAARLRASSARRSAMAGRGRARSVQCAQCGSEFQTRNSLARYCSDPCREKGRARADAAYRQRRRERERAGEATTAKCRVCSREFALGRGGARLTLYCSDECRAGWRRDYYREYRRRRRRGGSGA